MKSRSGVIAVILAAALLVFCLFLPNITAAARSRLDLGRTDVIEVGSVAFEVNPRLDLVDKLYLITTSDSVTLTGGKRFSEISAYQNAVAELRKMNSGHIMEIDLGGPDTLPHDIEVRFVISPSDPASSMVIWRLTIYDALGHSVTASFDDETGKILQLYYRVDAKGVYNASSASESSQSGASPAFPVTAELLARQMREYYGLDIAATDYERIGSLGYYTVQVKNGGKDIPAFGIISANGFSINDNHAL